VLRIGRELTKSYRRELGVSVVLEHGVRVRASILN